MAGNFESIGYITFVDCSHLNTASKPVELDINCTTNFGILPDFHNCYNLRLDDQSCYRSTEEVAISRPGFAASRNLVHYKIEYIGRLRKSVSTSVLFSHDQPRQKGKMRRLQWRSFRNSKQELP